MGKQLGFYMSPADEEHFIFALKSNCNVVVVLNCFSSPGLIELDEVTLKESVNRDGFGSLSLINKEIDPKVVIEPVGQGRYSIERSESEVIEFSRWTIIRNDGKKEPGRLWYGHEDLDCRPKRKPFLAWAQSVFRHIKKHYVYSGEHFGRYFGPDFWEKFQSGEVFLAPY